MTSAPVQSGYHVIARYGRGSEDPRPIADYPFTPDGLRQATNHAQKLGRSHDYRLDLYDAYQLDDDEFTAVVQEYQLQVRDVLSVPPHESRHELMGGPDRPLTLSRTGQTEELRATGYWPFWDKLFDVTGHGFTEAEAAAFIQDVETRVSRLAPLCTQPLDDAFRHLPEPLAVARTVLNLLREEPRYVFTAKRLLRRLNSDREFRSGDLDRFVAAFRTDRKRVCNAVLADSRLVVDRMPVGVREDFARDLRVFVGEELIRALTSQPVSDPSVVHA